MKVKNLTLTAIFTALIAVLTFITIPNPVTGVPITLQTFAVCLTGFFLGAKFGTISVVAYILIGLAGVPVFAGFKAGISVIAGPTGGFLIGFIFMSLICGCAKKLNNQFIQMFLGVCGLLICHLLGVVQYSLYSKSSLIASFLAVSLPFLLKDIISVVVALYASKAVNRLLLKNRINM